MNALKSSLLARRSSSEKKPTLQEQYEKFFTPQSGALRSNTERFEIFTLTDYSIPVYFSDRSNPVPHRE